MDSVPTSPETKHDKLNVSLTDEDVLARLGYKQEFKRDFSHLELFGMSFSIIGVVQSISAVLLYSIPYGGPAAMVWGWFTCSLFLFVVALAMAELGSAAPTAGGLYYWTFCFSSDKYRRVACWLIGYINTATYISGLVSVDWSIATEIMAAANIGSDGTFVATNGQVYALCAALLISHAIAGSLATKFVARIQYLYVSLNIALFLVVIIVIPTVTPPQFRNKASYALGQFENGTPWTNGYAFILSFLAPAWTVAGFDTSVHISEEARNAPRAVPFAIMSSTVASATLGWIVNIVLAFYMGNDLASVTGNAIGQPMATIFFNSIGKRGTLVIWTFIILTLWMTGMNYVIIAGSRQLFAFSRDRAFPFSSFLYRINPYTKTPVHASCFLAFMALILALISFAGPVAIGAVFTMSIISQYISFVTPIMARWLGGQKFVPGPFNLGFMSAPVAFVASVYMIFMIIVFLFPAEPGPDPQTMNYSVVVLGGTILLSLGYYFFPVYGGRYWFTGPVDTVHQNIAEKEARDGNDIEEGSA